MSEIAKIRELISKNESKMTDLENAIHKARDTFTNESRKAIEVATRVSIELDEWDKKMSTSDSRISELEKRRQEIKSEVNKLEQKTKETEKQYSSASSEMKSTQKEIEKAQNNLQQYKTKTDALKLELENLSKEADESRKSIESMKLTNEKEFENLEKEKAEFEQKTKELSEKEPVAHLLLSEAESEPPEVMIVAKLMKRDGQTSVDELRKDTKISSGMIAKTIEALEQKGIVTKADKNTIKLLKQ